MREGFFPAIDFFYPHILSGQTIATSHDLGPQKVAKEGKSPANSGKSRLVKYFNLARYFGLRGASFQLTSSACFKILSPPKNPTASFSPSTCERGNMETKTGSWSWQIKQKSAVTSWPWLFTLYFGDETLPSYFGMISQALKFQDPVMNQSLFHGSYHVSGISLTLLTTEVSWYDNEWGHLSSVWFFLRVCFLPKPAAVSSFRQGGWCREKRHFETGFLGSTFYPTDSGIFFDPKKKLKASLNFGRFFSM